MALNKSTGHMYPWVDLMHTHLGGRCPHECIYCYTQKNRFGVPKRYQGVPRLIEEELNINYYKYGKGKSIFIEHMNDLFADGIDTEWIRQILQHCNKYPDNQYVFQTKDPTMALSWFQDTDLFPDNFMIGTTIETNRDMSFETTQDKWSRLSKAPEPEKRCDIKYFAVDKTKLQHADDGKFIRSSKTPKIFVTLEPLCDFDVDILVGWLKDIKPTFINIGADSKKCGLPEPSAEKVVEFIAKLREAKISIRKKTNLERLLK